MRIAVCLSYLPDPATVEVDPLSGEIDFRRTLHILNPADAVALELALTIRRSEDTVLALTAGPEDAEVVLRDALAVGADDVLRTWEYDWATAPPAVSALMLATALRTEGLPDLVVCGTRTLAGGSGKVPALIAEFLGWPAVTDILDFNLHAARVRFQRRLDRGARADGEVTLPAVLAVEASGPPLRYASLPGVMNAKRAPIPVRHLTDLGLSPTDLNFPEATVRAAMPPYARPREIFIPGSDLPAHERALQILSAGVVQKSGRIVEGSAEDMADAIIDFLDEHGFLGRPA